MKRWLERRSEAGKLGDGPAFVLEGAHSILFEGLEYFYEVKYRVR